MKKKLTAKSVAKLKPEPKPYNVVDTELKGFLLRVQPSGDMVYYARYRFNGVQTQLRVGEASVLTPALARDKALVIFGQVADGIDPAAARRLARVDTLGRFIETDYNDKVLKLKRSGAATLDRLKRCFKFLWGRKLNDPTIGNAVINWRAKRIAAGKARTTVNRDIAALRAAFSWAVEQEYIADHPLAKIKPLKVDSAPKVRYLTDTEEKNLIGALDKREDEMRAARDNHNTWCAERGYVPWPDLKEVTYVDHLKPMVLVSLHTGLRRGELFSLIWEDIDLQKRTLTVAGTSSKSGNTRHIPLNATAFAALKDWRNQTRNRGLVFPSKDGKRFDNVNSAWATVLGNAGITDFRWHDMRHTFASKLVMAGVDLNTVRELLGHSDIKMTLRYAHLAPQVKAAAVERLVQPDSLIPLKEAAS